MLHVVDQGDSLMFSSTRSVGLILMAAVALLLGAREAGAGLTAEGCQAKKLQAQGSLLKCRASEEAKAVQGKPTDPTKCTMKFSDTLAKLNDKAATASINCRYRDNLDGTLCADLDPASSWEKKTTDASIHDLSNSYSWSDGGTDPDGTVFTDFLGELNDCESSDGSTVVGGFADHCDWRLPSIAELVEGIVDLTATGCGSGSPCIDPAFGPSVNNGYWSATTVATDSSSAWNVHILSGLVDLDLKVLGSNGVRAVRAGLL